MCLFKSVKVALLLAALSLCLTPAARAQLTFTVGTFTANQLTVTLQPSTLTGTSPANAADLYLLDRNSSTNNSWIIGSNFSVTPSGTDGVGSVMFNQIGTWNNDGTEDHILFRGTSSFVSGASITTPYQVTFSQVGAFNPSAITEMALVWGNAYSYTYQSSVMIPEPSTYAVLSGLFVLGIVVLRRRLGSS
jgi:hypothetical protein